MKIDKVLFGDEQIFTLWSLTHILFGYAFFIVLYKYFKLSVSNTVVILVLSHAIYEYKDYYINYILYSNDIDKIQAAHKIALKNSKTFSLLKQFGFDAKFHLPPNSLINTIGDTISHIIGIILGYYFRNDISPLMLKIISGVSLIYWSFVIISYMEIVTLGLHDNHVVNNLV